MKFPSDHFDPEFESAMRLVTEAMPNAEDLPKPTLLHCMRVAIYLYTRGHIREVCLAAILHDAIEDTPVTSGQIEQQFGRRVAELVEVNTKDESIVDYTAKYMTMMQRCIEAGEEGAIIKAADIMDNILYCRKAGDTKNGGRMIQAAEMLLERLPATYQDPVFEELRTCLSAFSTGNHESHT